MKEKIKEHIWRYIVIVSVYCVIRALIDVLNNHKFLLFDGNIIILLLVIYWLENSLFKK